MNILTFDIEDWFHILDNPSTKTISDWKNYETRIYSNMELIFDILARHNKKATFFCLGWIAETYPQVIKEIIGRGYEIGSHSHLHQLVFEQSKDRFAADLERSLKTLQDITSQKVKYFRAPGFSITESTKWAFEVLYNYEVEVDCSVFPASHAHGGFANYEEPIPSILKYNGCELKELPMNYISIFGKRVIFSGGGYFRLFPYFLIKSWTEKSNYVMSYLHPRDFDKNQPLIKELNLYRRFKSYVGLKSTRKKLDCWLNEFDFIDVGTAVNKIDWSIVPRVQL